MFIKAAYGLLLILSKMTMASGAYMALPDSQFTFQGGIDLQVYFAQVKSNSFSTRSTYRYMRNQDVTTDCSIRECFGKGVSLTSIPQGRYSDYSLLVQLGGELTSVDEVKFKNCRFDAGEIQIMLTVTKVESSDGEPFSVELYVLIPLNETIMSKLSLSIDADGYFRSNDGKLVSLKESPIQAVKIDFAEAR